MMMHESESDRQQVRKACSWEQIKLRLNENLHKAKNTKSEYLADSVPYGAKHFSSVGTGVYQDSIDCELG